MREVGKTIAGRRGWWQVVHYRPAGDGRIVCEWKVLVVDVPRNNAMTVVMFVAGGAFLATGIALLVVHGKNKKKAGKKKESTAAAARRFQLVGAGPAVLPGGGGASASVRF